MLCRALKRAAPSLCCPFFHHLAATFSSRPLPFPSLPFTLTSPSHSITDTTHIPSTNLYTRHSSSLPVPSPSCRPFLMIPRLPSHHSIRFSFNTPFLIPSHLALVISPSNLFFLTSVTCHSVCRSTTQYKATEQSANVRQRHRQESDDGSASRTPLDFTLKIKRTQISSPFSLTVTLSLCVPLPFFSFRFPHYSCFRPSNIRKMSKKFNKILGTYQGRASRE